MASSMFRDSLGTFLRIIPEYQKTQIYEKRSHYEIDISLEIQLLNRFAGLDKPIERTERKNHQRALQKEESN